MKAHALWMLLCLTLAGAVNAQELEVFVREGCPRCEEAHPFVERLQAEHPELSIVIRNISSDRAAFERLQSLSRDAGVLPGVPTFAIRSTLVVGYSGEPTEREVRSLLAGGDARPTSSDASCTPEAESPCVPAVPQEVATPWGGKLSVGKLGLPLFTVALGLIDGFNPCAMWVLLFLLALLVNLHNRAKMVAVAGTFVVISGLAYFVFMLAWLNVFMLIGVSRPAQLVLGALAVMVGLLNTRDGLRREGTRELSPHIPQAAKPTIYARVRTIIRARSVIAAIAGAAVLAVLVNLVELLCTAGLPAVYTQILTSRGLSGVEYAAYLALYVTAYMLDDAAMVTIAVVTMSRAKLQERGGRVLKLLSGGVMIGLGALLLVRPDWLP